MSAFMHEYAEDKNCSFYCAIVNCKDSFALTVIFLIASFHCLLFPSGDSSDRGGDSMSDPAEEHGHHCGEAPALYTRYHCCLCVSGMITLIPEIIRCYC